jgi:hypothetical protein
MSSPHDTYLEQVFENVDIQRRREGFCFTFQGKPYFGFPTMERAKSELAALVISADYAEAQDCCEVQARYEEYESYMHEPGIETYSEELGRELTYEEMTRGW